MPHVSAGYEAIKKYCLRNCQPRDHQRIEYSGELYDYAAAPHDTGWGLQHIALPRNLREVDFAKLISELKDEIAEYSMNSLYKQQANQELALHRVRIVQRSFPPTIEQQIK